MIGSTKWSYDLWHGERYSVDCPICGRTKKLEVHLFDGTVYSIDCNNCASGFGPPRGYLIRRRLAPLVYSGSVVGIDISSDPPDYRIKDEDGVVRITHHVFDTEEDASSAARAEIVKRDEEGLRRLSEKERDDRTWAWHVAYHRRQIREHRKKLEYHEAKLPIARAKAKEQKT